MKSKLPASVLVLLAVVNVSALATLAYHRWVRPESAAVPPVPASRVCLEEALSLDGRQKRCLIDLRLSLGREAEAARKRMGEKNKALVEEIKSETPDLTAVGKLIDEISGLQAEIQKLAVGHLIKEKELLTPEQKEKFFRLFENHVCPQGSPGCPAAADSGTPGVSRESEPES